MAEHCPNTDATMKIKSNPLKASNSLNTDFKATDAMDPARYVPPKTFFAACERPNTAMDFTNHKLNNFSMLKEQFRPQTSMGGQRGSDRPSPAAAAAAATSAHARVTAHHQHDGANDIQSRTTAPKLAS